MHHLYFIPERQQVDRVVPRAYDLDLVQQLLGHPLRVELRTPLRKWTDPDVHDDAGDKTVGVPGCILERQQVDRVVPRA